MHDDFVSFDQARKLKKLKFDWKCNHYYFMNDEELISYMPFDAFDSLYVDFNNSSYWNKDDCYAFSAPTLYQAQKWLREQYQIDINCSFSKESGEWCCWIIFMYDYVVKDIFLGDDESEYLRVDYYETYEKSLSAGIDETLRLLLLK